MTAARLTVVTNEGNGTLYVVVTQSSTAPNAFQVEGGADHNGDDADWAGNLAVTDVGTLVIDTEESPGLQADTTYYAHFMQKDAAGNRSAVVTSASFTLSDVSGPARYWRILISDTNHSATNELVAILELELIDGATGFGTNLATTPANADADEDNGAGTEASEAIDGHYADEGGKSWSTTANASPGLPHWWSYDFGAGNAKDITAVVIHGRYVNADSIAAQPKDFAIQASDDGVAWTTRWSQTGVTWAAYETKRFTKSGVDSYSGSPHGSHSHWRILTRRDDGGTISSASEIEMRATPGGADQCTGGTPTDGGNFGGFGASNAFDNNNSTSFFGVGTAEATWIAYEFASPVEVAQITWRNRGDAEANQAPRTFLVQYSDDGTNWTTAWAVLDSNGWSLGETRTFTDPNYV